MDAGGKQRFVRVDVADSSQKRLAEQYRLNPSPTLF
jgi:hypothetical protein